jgi:hypothetical protein
MVNELAQGFFFGIIGNCLQVFLPQADNFSPGAAIFPEQHALVYKKTVLVRRIEDRAKVTCG